MKGSRVREQTWTRKFKTRPRLLHVARNNRQLGRLEPGGEANLVFIVEF